MQLKTIRSNAARWLSDLKPWVILIMSSTTTIIALALLSQEMPDRLITIGASAVPIIIGLMALEIFRSNKPGWHVRFLLLPVLLGALVITIYGYGYRRLNSQLDAASTMVTTYRDLLEPVIKLPVSGEQPHRLHAFVLGLDNIREVRILGLNALSVLHSHRETLQRILLKNSSATLQVLLADPKDPHFVRKVGWEEGVELEREKVDGVEIPKGKVSGRIEHEWKASVAILRDIFNQLHNKHGLSNHSLRQRFEVRFYRGNPDRSMLYVDGEDYINKKNGVREPSPKRYLLFNRYPDDLKYFGQKSLSLLIDDRFVEFDETLDKFDDLWKKAANNQYTLEQMDADLRFVTLPTDKKRESLATVLTELEPLATAFMQLSAASVWDLRDTIELKFQIYHPQGIVKVGSHFLVSSVEVLEEREKIEGAIPGEPDRTLGKGKGHVFKIAEDGTRVAEVQIGDGSGIYHPGGMDFDGTYVWVPVAEYRPHSRSILYKLDPQTLRVEEAFSVNDHIGDVVYDRQSNVIHGASWDSRVFYTWDLEGRELRRDANPSDYIRYQDCKYVRSRYMLCSGMTEFSHPISGKTAMGGLALLDLLTHRRVYEFPVFVYPNKEDPLIVITRNPMYAELRGGEATFYFLPENGSSSAIYEYAAIPTK